jgi:hypothetical protein
MIPASYIAFGIGLDQPQIIRACPEGHCITRNDIPAIEGLLD